ncbi:HAD-IA family hydrolase [uncultured Eubacterium sp.]|uniref:HAD-IA family hydrolase n=1 Tax=uncultured Eubacterium sp. TaxID=165185 RepID=UPI0015BD5076|nr:HAD-IA family hydrolase [uncultured Eubacterium sp.]
MVKAVVFDFDGTLCDTGVGVKKSAKYALDAFGIKAPEWEELDFFIGPPLLVTFQERFNQSVTDAEKLVKKYRERYTNIGLYESEFYDGIPQLIKDLKSQGFKLGIASSKPINYIEELLIKADLQSYFDYISAVSFNADCESKQSILERCLNELGVEPSEAIMVGDRFYDIDGARGAGVDSVGVLWGFGSKFELIESGATYVVDKIQDIESIALGMYERTENVQGIHNGRVLNFHVDDITLCNGEKATRECVDHPGGVGIIALTDDECVYMVRQFRYPYKESIYEIPAGKREKDEDPLETGKRELQEECGVVAENYIDLGKIYPSPGYTNEEIYLYAATGLTEVEQNLDEDEFLQVTKMKLTTLITKIMSGEITDAKTIAAAFKLKELRNIK